MSEDQIKLFDIPPIRIARPSRDSNKVIEMAVASLVENIEVDDVWDGDWSDQTFEELLVDIFKNHRVSLDDDGYEICKELEGFGINPNADLVESMDSGGYNIREAHNHFVKEWVKDCRITPGLKIGDEVNFKRGNEGNIGEIIEIRLETAEYVVFCKELGHVKVGSGTTGSIIKFEEVEEDFFKVNK